MIYCSENKKNEKTIFLIITFRFLLNRLKVQRFDLILNAF